MIPAKQKIKYDFIKWAVSFTRIPMKIRSNLFYSIVHTIFGWILIEPWSIV